MSKTSTTRHEMHPAKRAVFVTLLAAADGALRLVEAVARWRRRRASRGGL